MNTYEKWIIEKNRKKNADDEEGKNNVILTLFIHKKALFSWDKI